MRRDIVLWSTVACGPVVWMLSFGANWSSAWWACIWQWTPGQYTVWAIALAMTAVSGLAARSQWHSLGRGLPGEAGGAIPRSRALAIGGMALSLGSFLLILAQGLVSGLAETCG